MDTKQLWKKFIRRISLVITLFALGMFLGLFVKTKQLVNDEVISRSQTHFRNIVLTRRWNAQFNGVYVEKTEGVVSNSYLENPDITTVDGKVFTKKNPALMTREISEFAREDSLYSFHITSLKPLNPGNAPDEFEQEALLAFELGESEAYTKFRTLDKTYFRYMAPLPVEEACLQCHAKQGYQVGDIRGGISVLLDISEVERGLRINNILIFIFSALALAILLIVTYAFIRRLMASIEKSQQIITEMAIIDDLTRLHNRRHFFDKLKDEFSRAVRHARDISAIMIDIDHFKNFNDTYGHQTGDLVLKTVGQTIKSQTRNTDTVARYGGEEFVLLLPETNLSGAQIFAEKIRSAVEETVVQSTNNELKVMISLGVCSVKGYELKELADESELIKRADQALYTAKAQGRNRVVVSRE